MNIDEFYGDFSFDILFSNFFKVILLILIYSLFYMLATLLFNESNKENRIVTFVTSVMVKTVTYYLNILYLMISNIEFEEIFGGIILISFFIIIATEGIIYNKIIKKKLYDGVLISIGANCLTSLIFAFLLVICF